jgi:hypothetical protein
MRLLRVSTFAQKGLWQEKGPQMTLERLHELHQARPFQAFRVHLADGRSLDVTHPESLAYAPKARTIILVKPDERVEHVDLLLVTSLEITNGSRSAPRRRRQT